MGRPRNPKGQPMKNPHAVALSRLGASKGGRARSKALSKARRAEIAKLAGLASGAARRRKNSLTG